MRIKGKERLVKVLAKMPREVRKEVRAQLEKSAKQISEMQQRLAPVDDGDLRRSISYTFGVYKAENSNVRGVAAGSGLGDPDLSVTLHAGDAKAYYAAWIEFGVSGPWTVGGKFAGATHPGIGRQAYFMPAFRAGRKSAKSGITRAVKRGIKQAIGGTK